MRIYELTDLDLKIYTSSETAHDPHDPTCFGQRAVGDEVSDAVSPSEDGESQDGGVDVGDDAESAQNAHNLVR